MAFTVRFATPSTQATKTISTTKTKVITTRKKLENIQTSSEIAYLKVCCSIGLNDVIKRKEHCATNMTDITRKEHCVTN